MISTQHTQSLTDFRQKATETLDRLSKTGEAEILTVNGEARAVLMSPAVYDELAREAQLVRDAAVISRSRKEFKEGKGEDVNSLFKELRGERLERKKKQTKGNASSSRRIKPKWDRRP